MSGDCPAEPVLVLDFDGVLCDSADECLQVAWLAHAGAPVEAFVEQGIAAVPAEVAERFASMRPFMRRLEHFLVALIDAPPAADAEAFDACFDQLPSEQTTAFAAAAQSYRDSVRTQYASQWLACHRVQPRVAPLAAHSYIATARDGESVVAILEAHGIAPQRTKIYHSLREKITALGSIAAREAVRPHDVWLIDDSVQNCLAAQAAGFGATWASWGYHVGLDADIARSHGIPVACPSDLPRSPTPMA